LHTNKQHGKVLIVAYFIFSAKPCFDAKRVSGNVKKLIVSRKKSHVWHASMHLRNAKILGFIIVPGPPMHN
jgi:hypothetical protein